jgi:hypothetical protein
MNPLAALKEKLMIKPNVEDRERVAVVIKGIKKHRKPKIPKKIEEKDGEEEEKEVEEKDVELIEVEEPVKNAPVIVDETEKGFDRDALKKKLLESKKLKVTVKETVKVSEEKKVSEPLPLSVIPPSSYQLTISSKRSRNKS